MPKYKGVYLLELGRSAFKICSEGPIFHINRRISTTKTWRSRSEQSSKTTNRGKDREDDETGRSSSFHQTYHRRSYERKRTDYERRRNNGHENSSRTISFMANPSTTHYQRLNVDPSANLDTIKSAYYSLSKQYHPDIVGKDDPNAIENFRLITDAYDILSNPKSKAEYDKQIQPDTESSLDSAYTLWKPQGYNDQGQETVFRMREAHRIFQSKQDEALAKEKERNPNKFRSGVFRYDSDDIEFARQRFESQIRFMDACSARESSSVFHKTDGNEFYRTHLYGTVMRKQQELREYQEGKQNVSDDALLVSLATIVGILALIVLTSVDAIYDLDIASFLDSKLETKTTKDINVKREH